MGREIIIEGYCHNKKIDFSPEDLYVCGRDDATTFIANYVINNQKNDDDCYVDLYLHKDEDYKKYKYICNELEDYKKKDYKEIDKAHQTLNQLLLAQSHANYEDFFKFQHSIEETQNWIETESYSRAEDLLRYMRIVEYCIMKEQGKCADDAYYLRIIWSE